jgi:prepilin-type N-terminal cleavage/methylation domain-containing protein
MVQLKRKQDELMTFKTKNQNGFSLIEILLVLILVSVIGFTGFYVYSQKGSNSKDADASAAGKNAATNSEPQSDHLEYKDPKGFSLQYPKDWKFVAKGTKTQDKDSGMNEFSSNQFLPSADYPKILLNHQIAFSSFESTSTPSELIQNQFNNKVGNAIKVSSKETKINGNIATVVNYKDSMDEPNLFVVYIKHGNIVVQFDYSKDPQKPGYDLVHQSVVNSTKFND